MSKKAAMISTAVTSVLALGALALTMPASAQEMEKCYGVVKAGKNDCAGPGHTCQGQARTDGSDQEFIMLPAGTCDRLAGGEANSA